MKTHPVLTAALLTLLHHTTTFAMDPQEAKGIIGELEQFCNDRIHQPASGRLEKEEDENQNTLLIRKRDLSLISSPSFSSSSSGSGEASFATLSESPRNETMHISEEDEKNITPAETSIVIYSNIPSESVIKVSEDNNVQSDLAIQALEKASNAIAANQKEIAEFWGKSAELYQELAEYDRQAKKAAISDHRTKLASFGLFELYDPFEEAAHSSRCSYQELDFAAKALEQAFEATDKNQGEIAALCCKAAEQHQEAAEYYCQAAKTLVRDIEDIKDAQKRKRFDFFEQAATAARNGAARLDSAVQALEKAIKATAANQEEIAALWRKTSEQYQESAAYHRQAMKAMLSNNATEHDCFYNFKDAAKAAMWSAGALYSAVDSLEKASEAVLANQKDVAALWSKSAEQHQEAAEYFRQAAQSAISENARFCDFKEASEFSKDGAHKLGTAARALPSVECALRNHQNSSNSVCSSSSPLPSSISYFPSPAAAAASPSSILPISRLGAHILSFRPEMIFQFLRSPEPKQSAYKAAHEQTVQELQVQYPNLAEKIADWNQAIEVWNRSYIPEEQGVCYQNVVALSSAMPPELYRLVALSQAMKIMKDAIIYSYYLPLALEKYDKDAETEEARTMATRSKIILLAQIDTINNNILNLEKAADAILTLAEKRNDCLAFAAEATKVGHFNAADQFETAAIVAKEAIVFYLQFAQKMKEGDISAASLFYMGGECQAMHSEFRALGAVAIEGWNESLLAALRLTNVSLLIQRVVQAKSDGAVELAEACEQEVQYLFQFARAHVNGDLTKKGNFMNAYGSAKKKSGLLEKAVKARTDGNIEVAKTHEQEAHYHHRRAEVYAQEGIEKGDAFLPKVYDEELRQQEEGVNILPNESNIKVRPNK